MSVDLTKTMEVLVVHGVHTRKVSEAPQLPPCHVMYENKFIEKDAGMF